MPTSTARHRERPRRAHAVGAALAAASVLGALVTGLAVPAAQAAGGTVLLEDNFMSSTVQGAAYVVGGRNGTSCLTASTNGAQTPVPGCTDPLVGDPDGSGALRLTPAVNDRAGFLLYDKALPTKAGLDITFNQYQWGGSAADGISFFLTDGSRTLSEAGGLGGSLGYNNNNGNAPGVSDALLGVGFDVFGNYTVETHNEDCADGAYRNGALQKSTVAVRGPGNGYSGYCLLGPVAPAPALDQSSSPVRPAPVATRIVIDPPSVASPHVTVFLDGVQVTQVPQPAEFATTPTFKFGWGASTGGQNNNHEINFLKVESVDPILPDLGVTGATPAVANATNANELSWTVDTDAASGPLPAGEPVLLRLAAPPGTGISASNSPGWSCANANAALVECTHVPGSSVAPGSTLPPVSAWSYVNGSGSGAHTFTATVSSPTNDPALAADDSYGTTAVWRPVANYAHGGGMYASHQPGSLQIAPYAFGSNLSFEIVTPADPAVGTVSVNGPYVRFSPAPGASGPLNATFRAFDGTSWSDTAPATSTVLPVAASDAVTAPQGTTTTRQLPAGTGTSLTYELLTDDVPGTVSLSPSGELQVAPGTGDSGVFTASYRVVDSYGTASDAATVTVTVPPTAGTTSWTSSLDADGEAGTVLTLPTPAGTGPFTYQLVGGLPAGTTGSLTGDQLAVDAVAGTSGAHTVTYTVTDGDAVVSDPQTVDVTFRPYAALADAAGTAAAPVTTDVPTTVGTGPFTTVAEGASGGTASVTSDGRVVLDTDGASGRFTVDVHVEDANGVASSTQVVQVEVSPVAHDVSGEAVAAATPSPVVLTPATPTGTGPFTLTVVSGPATASGATLAVTPAAGASGVVEVEYTVTDGQGLVSEPATATLTVRPAAAGSAEQLESGTSATFALPAPVGTGPFTHQLVSAASGPWGTLSVVDGELQVTAASTFSGPMVVRYTVTDAATLVSDEVEVTLDVVPATPGGSVPTQAQATGTAGSPVTGPTPAPTGTGPFTFELVGTVPPEQGTATIDPATGVITFVPAPGWSGEATVAYRVVDGNGDPSAPSAVVFAVAPVATTTPVPPTRTPAGSPATVQAPAPVGTGPFTFELVGTLPPSVGTVTIDPVTGVVTFVPAPGWSGEAPVQYRVLDGNGDPSAPSEVLFVVAPVAPAAAAPATTPAGTPLTVTLPTPVGTGPFTFTLVDGPTPDQGTLTLDPVTGEVRFVPAAGYAGTFEITYTVTDANGVVSDPQVLEVTVAAPPAPAVRVPATVTQAARAVVSALPRTGGELALVGGLAGGLVLAGGALVLLTRRRTTG